MIAWLVIVVCTMAAVELLLRLPIARSVTRLRETLARATATVRSSTVSDHWKERALTAYARRMLSASVTLFLLLLAVLTPFVVAAPLAYLAGQDILKPISSVGRTAATSAGAIVYAGLRVRFAGRL